MLRKDDRVLKVCLRMVYPVADLGEGPRGHGPPYFGYKKKSQKEEKPVG